MTASPYNEPAYRAARAVLAQGGYLCWHCGQPASSPDHYPPLVEHHHQPDTGCCELRPSCRSCNYSLGAAAGNRLRRPRPRSHLAPGSGWAR